MDRVEQLGGRRGRRREQRRRQRRRELQLVGDVSNASWMTVTSGASGSGPGTVAFSVAANTGAARTGTLTIAGQTFTVTQAAPCTYAIASNSLVGRRGRRRGVNVRRTAPAELQLDGGVSNSTSG